MWPFSLRSALRNRWWTLAFAAFVCWQAVELAAPDTEDGDAGVNAQQVAAVADALGR